MTSYIGGTAGLPSKYFYRLRRNDIGELWLTKVDMNYDTEEIDLVSPSSRGTDEEQADIDSFDVGLVVVNIDENHELIQNSLGRSQFKISSDDLHYFLNENGELILRINGSYSYPENV